ncbi:MAG TPA: hotdog fold thioesterase, partial [Vicinamibacterales bacterium]|nr:hotdog fold thioesterase [Vicinamibacterales bacterium]
MSSWVTPRTIAELTAASRNTASAAVGIQFTAIGDDWIEATLPLDERTQRDAGVVDPGALAILAETLGSIAATMCIDATRQMCL